MRPVSGELAPILEGIGFDGRGWIELVAVRQPVPARRGRRSRWMPKQPDAARPRAGAAYDSQQSAARLFLQQLVAAP